MIEEQFFNDINKYHSEAVKLIQSIKKEIIVKIFVYFQQHRKIYFFELEEILFSEDPNILALFELKQALTIKRVLLKLNFSKIIIFYLLVDGLIVTFFDFFNKLISVVVHKDEILQKNYMKIESLRKRARNYKLSEYLCLLKKQQI